MPFIDAVRILLDAADVDSNDFGLAGFGPLGGPGQSQLAEVD